MIGLIASALVTTAISTFSLSVDWSFLNLRFFLGIALLAIFLFMLYKKVNPIKVIATSAVAGILVGFI